jgi:hypothetical protein
MLDELEAEVSGDRPAFLTKNPKMSLDDIEAEVTSAPAPNETRPIKNTGPDMAGEVRGAVERATVENQKPSALDAAYAGLRRGASFGFSDELEGLTNRAADVVGGRNLSDVTAGTRQPSYAEYRNAARARDAAATGAHPWAAMGGEALGGLATSVVPGLGPSASAGETAFMTAARAGAKQGALYGLGNSEADLTKGDVGGALRDTAEGSAVGGVTAGLLGKLVRGAPERVDQRVIKSINVGDDTNSKISTARKVMAKAGEEGSDLLDILDTNPTMKKMLATKAASNPRAAEKFVAKRLEHLNGQTPAIYDAIDSKAGGVDLSTIDDRLAKAGSGFVGEGKALMAGAIEKARANLAKLYGSDTDAGRQLLSGTMLPSRAVRNYANEVGEVAFAGDPTASPKAIARGKQALYREIVDAIADTGEKAGVDVGKLKALNKEISTLIPIRQALTERAVQKEAGRSSLAETIKKAAVPALGGMVGVSGGGASGGLAAGGAALGVYGATKASKPLARAADWQLAKLVRASRAGSTPAQLGQLAIEMGLSRVVGEKLADQFRDTE